MSFEQDSEDKEKIQKVECLEDVLGGADWFSGIRERIENSVHPDMTGWVTENGLFFWKLQNLRDKTENSNFSENNSYKKKRN